MAHAASAVQAEALPTDMVLLAAACSMQLHVRGSGLCTCCTVLLLQTGQSKNWTAASLSVVVVGASGDLVSG